MPGDRAQYAHHLHRAIEAVVQPKPRRIIGNFELPARFIRQFGDEHGSVLQVLLRCRCQVLEHYLEHTMLCIIARGGQERAKYRIAVEVRQA